MNFHMKFRNHTTFVYISIFLDDPAVCLIFRRCSSHLVPGGPRDSFGGSAVYGVRWDRNDSLKRSHKNRKQSRNGSCKIIQSQVFTLFFLGELVAGKAPKRSEQCWGWHIWVICRKVMKSCTEDALPESPCVERRGFNPGRPCPKPKATLQESEDSEARRKQWALPCHDRSDQRNGVGHHGGTLFWTIYNNIYIYIYTAYTITYDDNWWYII